MYHITKMIYPRRSSSTWIFWVVLAGVIAGSLFMLIDRRRTTPQPVSRAEVTPTLAPTREPTPELTLSPTATPLPKASLRIPTAGVNVDVVDVYLDGESWNVRELGDYAGHLEGTARIGQPGNVALAGHVETREGKPGIFARLETMNIGDPVILSLDGVEQRYTVTAVRRVPPDDLSVLYPSTTDKITLITCDDYDFLQNRYLERVVVVAERVT
jgi:LPXTG-site transpeptidase (sortase) family protein